MGAVIGLWVCECHVPRKDPVGVQAFVVIVLYLDCHRMLDNVLPIMVILCFILSVICPWIFQSDPSLHTSITAHA